MTCATARFSIAALAAWRVTHLLAEEDGPADIVLRARVAVGDTPAGALMDCFQCLSVWTAIPFALGAPRGRRVTWWLALSGAACLLESAMMRNQEDDDGLLWQGARGAQDRSPGDGDSSDTCGDPCAAAGGAAATSWADRGGHAAPEPHRTATGAERGGAAAGPRPLRP